MDRRHIRCRCLLLDHYYQRHLYTMLQKRNNIPTSVHNDMLCILSQKRNNIPISAQREGVCSICNTTTFLVIHDHHQLPDGTHFPPFFLYLSIYRGNTCKKNVQTFSLRNLFPFCTEGTRSCYKGYFTGFDIYLPGEVAFRWLLTIINGHISPPLISLLVNIYFLEKASSKSF